MAPTTLATGAVTLLSPYLAKAGEKAVEEIGKKLPTMVGNLWHAITTRFTGKPAAEKAAKDLAVKPNDADNQAAFCKELRKVLDAEPAFTTELTRLLAGAQNAENTTILNTGSGAVAISGGIAAGAGGVAVKGNIQGDFTLNTSEKKG